MMGFIFNWEPILVNVSLILVWFVLLCITMLANILIKTFYNVNILGQSFDIKRFLSGLVKVLVVGLSASLLGVVASAIPEILKLTPVLEIPDEFASAVSIIAIITVFAYSVFKYFKDSIVAIKDAVDNWSFTADDSER